MFLNYRKNKIIISILFVSLICLLSENLNNFSVSAESNKINYSKLSETKIISRISSDFKIDPKTINELTVEKINFSENIKLTPEVDDSKYKLVFLSKERIELDSIRFEIRLSEAEYGESSYFIDVYTILPDNTSIVQLLIDEIIICEKIKSDNAPSVKIISPKSGELVEKTFSIQWESSDLDNDKLLYNVKSSCDNISWSILAVSYEKNMISANYEFIGKGTECRIRIEATDGWNETETSLAFLLPNRPPNIHILYPSLAYNSNEYIQSECEKLGAKIRTHDPETGEITNDEAIKWTSNLDGYLGKGHSITKKLSSGQHLISVTVTDPDGISSTKTVTVKITGDRNCDGISDFTEKIIILFTILIIGILFFGIFQLIKKFRKFFKR